MLDFLLPIHYTNGVGCEKRNSVTSFGGITQLVE